MPKAVRVAILHKQGGVIHWHSDLAAGFAERGAEVVSIPTRPVTLDEHRGKWRAKTHALDTAAIATRIARALVAARPDLVIVLNQAGLPAATAAAWRSALPHGTPLIGWLCDHLPALPSWAGANLDGVYHFDSASRPVLESAYAGTNARIAHLPLAVNPARYPVGNTPFTLRRRALVSACCHSPERVARIEAYRKLGGLVSAYGPGAPCGLRLWRHRRLNAAQLARLYDQHFAVLNLRQTPNTINGLNLRAFEVPASGGLATYRLVPDLAQAFVPGEEVVAYDDIADLKTRIDALLDRPERAAQIAAAGRARVLRDHTFMHRASRFIEDWVN